MSLTKKQRAWIVRLLPAALPMIVAIASGVWLWGQTRPYESSDYADVTWDVGGLPSMFSCSVVDSSGTPVPKVAVAFLSNSGWTEPVLTDERGYAKVWAEESDVEGIRIDRVQIMNRTYAYWLGTPNVRRGLRVKIVVKGSPFLSGRAVPEAGRGRTAGCPAAPAQIPASGTTAPGSYLRSDAQSLCRIRMVDSRSR
jgi:hypothetical protein